MTISRTLSLTVGSFKLLVRSWNECVSLHIFLIHSTKPSPFWYVVWETEKGASREPPNFYLKPQLSSHIYYSTWYIYLPSHENIEVKMNMFSEWWWFSWYGVKLGDKEMVTGRAWRSDDLRVRWRSANLGKRTVRLEIWDLRDDDFIIIYTETTKTTTCSRTELMNVSNFATHFPPSACSQQLYKSRHTTPDLETRKCRDQKEILTSFGLSL